MCEHVKKGRPIWQRLAMVSRTSSWLAWGYGHHGEKATDLVSTLIAKGELTVEQGKQINTELAHKAANVAQSARFDALEARMSVMTPEEREAFAAKAAEIAARPAAQPVQEQPQAEDSQEPSEQAEASAEQ